ncbi:hypothetical protein AALM74_07445 [Parabacteroides segnis]|uniref:hypothetical protein n=1 Tax=Parabacteroides segnis TaxID=2763058 RepID=UPI00351582F0
MKLRNLLFGTMIACAFVACSNDDDPIDNGGGNTDGKTLLQVSPNVIKTKAAIAGKDFKVYVIDNAGNVVAEGKANEAFAVPTEAEGNVEIVVLKNMPETFGSGTDADKKITKKSDLLAAIDFSETEESFASDPTSSQNTAFYKVSILRGEKNMLGYSTAEVEKESGNNLDAAITTSIPAYRNVSWIDLERVTLVENPKYPNAKFEIDEAFILNARRYSHMAADSYTIWPVTEFVDDNYLCGVDYDTYANWDEEANEIAPGEKYITTIAKDNFKDYVHDANVVPAEAKGYKKPIGKVIDGKFVKVTLPREDANNSRTFKPEWAASFFTYENTDKSNPTLLVVKGIYTYTNAEGHRIPANPEPRYYTIEVGKLITSGIIDLSQFGIKDISEIVGVRRNIQYNVSLNVSGPGSKNPLIPGTEEITYMDASVTLVPWGRVSQEETIE